MGRLSLLSIGLFVLPIAITVAILVGVETWRVSQGKPSLANQDNRLTTEIYCQKEYGVQPNPGRYVCECPCISHDLARSEHLPRLPLTTEFRCLNRTRSSATGAILLAGWSDSTVAIFRFDSPRPANTETVNPNQWGVVEGDPLNLCMNVGLRHFSSRLPRQLEPIISVTGRS